MTDFPDLNQIPAKNEITVLPEDSPGKRMIGLVVEEFNGTQIKRLRPPRGGAVPITEEGDLEEGQEILVPSFYQDAYIPMVTHRNEDGSLMAKSKSGVTLAVLKYDQERHYWICLGLINTRGLERLQINRSTG